MTALLALTVANIKSYVRDRAALFWTLAFPLIFIFMFGFIFQGGGGDASTIGWVDEDGTAAVRRSCAPRSRPQETIELVDAERGRALEQMREGEVDAVIVVPAGYGEAVAAAAGGDAAPPASIIVYTDPSRQNLTGAVYQAVGAVLGVVNLGGRPPLVVPDAGDDPDREPQLHQLLRAVDARPVGHAGRHLRRHPARRRPREAHPQATRRDAAAALAAGRHRTS